jgi:hypothetical protein
MNITIILSIISLIFSVFAIITIVIIFPMWLNKVSSNASVNAVSSNTSVNASYVAVFDSMNSKFIKNEELILNGSTISTEGEKITISGGNGEIIVGEKGNIITGNTELKTGSNPFKINTNQLVTESVLRLTNTETNVDCFITNESPENITANTGNLAIDITPVTGGLYINNSDWFPLMIGKSTVQTMLTTSTYNLPDGCRYVIIELQAGGASGRTIMLTLADKVEVGSSGGGGQYLKVLMTASQINALVDKTVTVGKGGDGLGGVTNNGEVGFPSKFGGFFCQGGQVGRLFQADTHVSITGGSGGKNTTQGIGTIIQNIPGGTGGESSASIVSAGVLSLFTGNGGNSMLGYGGNGNISVSEIDTTKFVNGSVGTGFGGGGSGTASYYLNNQVIANNGADGIVIFTEFY